MVSIATVRENNSAITGLYGSGLVAVFVGGTSGIGESTARAFIRSTQASRAYLIGRDQARAHQIIGELQQLNPDAQITFIRSDVSLLREVDEACRAIQQQEDKVNILFLSPGVGTMNGRDEIAAAFPHGIQGKNIIVTGVSPNSLGLATADAFASQSPANLILTGRSSEKVEASITSLRSKYPNIQYHALIMDLASQSSVRAAAAKLNQDDSIPTIDILVNNAGVMAIQALTLSEDGIETTFATNHLGHFLFTNLILAKIIKAARTSSTPTRIINVSSFGHQFSPVRFSDINFSKRPADLPADERPDFEKTEFFTGSSHSEDTYYGFFSYAQSKTANILFSIALNQRLWAKYGIASFAVHPGAVGTNINRHATPAEIEQAVKRVAELGLDASSKTPEQGANSSVLAAVDPGLSPVDDEVKGVYIADCRVDDANVAGFAKNRHVAEKLWALSEGLVQQKFEI
ncbi:short-chain dehydrogenase [Aspergillus violaceofuscus CBS 115571]|uniref:Short-chain dehydrogenase n=1 Tax=Aspergillus violaceofuscus (strain CBS 115571) TaxID=1450538 RepID=A0A2V5GZJ7_ASPV1|nr:short-chain dehydrogenase [Aspergillus violaceofuscus CBS 115571]